MSSAEKRKISSSTDQDSTEKRMCIMEELEEEEEVKEEGEVEEEEEAEEEEEVEEEQTSDEREIENISTENIPKKQQTVSLPSSPSITSFSETQIKSSILNHTWKINQFLWLCNTMNTITSPPFPETGQYVIKMKVSSRCDSTNLISFYILTINNTFNALCTTSIILSCGRVLFSKSITGSISNNTLLIQICGGELPLLDKKNALVIRCKFEFFCNLINRTIRTNSLPSSTEYSKHVTYFEDLAFDEFWLKNKSVLW
ncbi:uncharacterized protein LOC112465860 [Temnothorax curvispinosus]|uniref:Uncharacterized protein LOC112465860 n=1 Tax=Temnothorax curvispinosus TaxID=300111 RepID=A0A6J1R8Y3_9HYME|nr:uncharacterized protein LOC112465860 [Temnothorax curvispinosus]XP_024889396.1 uncharacterized protein LOC112465860 [Temnothorax curvispinosus]